ASIAHYHPLDEVMLIEHEADLHGVLDRAIALSPTRARRRAAFRFIYRRYSHMQVPFPLVAMEGPWKTVLTYSTPDALAPGADAGLDRICDFLLTGTPVFTAPDAAERAVSEADEDALHAALEADPVWYHAQLPPLPFAERFKRAVVFCVKPVYKATKPMIRPLERMVNNLERRIAAS
ncbi:MAG TPA: hypothetical protein VKT77_02710, partial [Chthonomonadaceae bacterium]|nr:hypothetical protein [Chthonomonadaceae bacterium]